MTIEEKLKESKIKNLLVVDDTKENIFAAKNYFENFKTLKVDYLSNSKEAIEKIKSKSYDFIITDLEMETKDAGLDVIKEGLRNYTLGVIVTGRSGDAGHGPSTSLRPTYESVKGKKDEVEVWEQLFEKCLEYYSNESTLRLKSAIERNKEYVGKMNEDLIEKTLSMYK